MLAGGLGRERSEKEAKIQGLKKIIRSEKVIFPTAYSQIVKWAMWNHCIPWVSHLQRKILLCMLSGRLGPDVSHPSLSVYVCKHFGFGI